MRRYWIEKKDVLGERVNFSGDTFHHIFDVCRQEVGSKFEVLTEDSKAFLVQVTSVRKKEAEAQVLEERQIPPLPEPRIHLVLAVSRFPVMDAVVEKAVELGVTSIQPVFSEFSFVRTTSALSENKIERWEKIVRSATQQSGRGDLMILPAAVRLDDFLSSFNQKTRSLGLFAYEGNSTLSIKDYLRDQKKSRTENVADVWIFVGSEGGFSQAEVEKMRNLALHPVTLGPQILRVETACMALVSVLKYEFDLMC
jgi:16S rRNA (uracil1498-N3)-methyltransferase